MDQEEVAIDEVAQMATYDKQSIFSYTAERFFFKEEIRMKERHVEFDIEALKNAAKASDGREHGNVTSMTRIGEGGFQLRFMPSTRRWFRNDREDPISHHGAKILRYS